MNRSLLKWVFLAATVAVAGCASNKATLTKKEYRKVLIIGFANNEFITPEDLARVMNGLERQIEQQRDDDLGFRVIHKVQKEVAWNSEVLRSYATSNGFDDVFAVALDIGIKSSHDLNDNTCYLFTKAATGSASVKMTYVNSDSGESDFLGEEHKDGSSCVGSGASRAAIVVDLIKDIAAAASEMTLPKLRARQRLSQVVERKIARASKERLAVGTLTFLNVDEGAKAAIPDLIADAISRSSKFLPVARSAELESILKEQATTSSQAFNADTAAKIGILSGAPLLVNVKIICEKSQCLINSFLYDLKTGEVLKTSINDSDHQLTALRNGINNMLATLEGYQR